MDYIKILQYELWKKKSEFNKESHLSLVGNVSAEISKILTDDGFIKQKIIGAKENEKCICELIIYI